MDLRARVLLSATFALVGEVFPGLCKVDVSWDSSQIYLKFFVDRAPGEDDLESISCIETEILADLYPEFLVSSTVVLPGEQSARGDECIFAVRPPDM
jgi:hypothetical protein